VSARPSRRIVEGSSVDRDLSLNADACVIGSGAGGAVVARALAESGMRVVVLEEGPYVPSRAFVKDEGESRLRLYRDGGFRGSADRSLILLEGRCVGGSTVVGLGTAMPAPAEVLDRWARSSGVTDLAPAGLADRFARIAREISVAPVPDAMINPNNALLRRGAARLRLSSDVLPRAVRGCAGCGRCAEGCPTDAKRSMLVSYVPKALRAGATLYADARADAVLFSGGAVRGVRGAILERATRRRKRSLEVRAPVIVVAAGAIESPSLLLRSHVPDRSGLLGKKLRVNPSVPVIGTFDAPIRGYRGIPQSVWSAQFADLRAGKGGYMFEGDFAGPATFGSTLPGFGVAHKRILSRYNRMALVSVVLQDRSAGEVRVGRGATVEIRYEPRKEDRAKLLEGVRRAALLLFRAGAHEVFAGPRTNAILGDEMDLVQLDRPEFRRMALRMTATRPQGTCRMGADPSRSVIGPRGEVHGVKGLFVADASVFPGPLGVPPQMTVMALAARTAEAIAASAGARRSPS